MSYRQGVEEVKHWESGDKWRLLEILLRDLRTASEEGTAPVRQLSQQERLNIAHELHGSIRPANGHIPKDEEVRQIIDEERLRKYL